ncbi:thioesterase family protein [Enterococcus nangangensis]|uniref:thioesterase family protein n=1 Tax=Enterococcus nangangensis TaxID=2559926 RepID=UPI001FEBE0FF|nr:hotdog domain-containing protein [Enterococcus nangangensis]
MEKDFVVSSADTAAVLGSGLLPVLATPKVVALVENTCFESIAEKLVTGESTVGVKMSIEHLKASAVGDTVTVSTTLVKEGKKSFTFTFEVRDQKTKAILAQGEHVRVRVISEKFLADLNR